MRLIEQPPTSEAPAEVFTGDVWWDVIHRGDETSWLEHVSDAEYGAARFSTRR
ncbi:hypothetical protein AB0K40_10925 [Nonomuraea bangladeshensis]|uniref:Uncharacterized protein n=1 Tax=Nonomuraea bangladeshensis TaxID=404385 RepID=A0ABV3H133_9ACTN